MSETPSNDDKSQNVSELLDDELNDGKYSSEVPAASTISEDLDHSSIDIEFTLKQFLLKPRDPMDFLELILSFMFGETVFEIEDLNFSMHNNNTRVLMQFYEEMTNMLNANMMMNYFDNVFGKDVSGLFVPLIIDKSESELKEFFQEFLKIPTRILENIGTSVISEHEFMQELLMGILKEYDYYIYPYVKRFCDNFPMLLEEYESHNALHLGVALLMYAKLVKEYLENQKNTDDEATTKRKFIEFMQLVHTCTSFEK